MGVLFPSDCFDRLPKLRRGKKFDWLYDKCCERRTFDSVIHTIGGTTLLSVLHYINTNQNHDQKAALNMSTNGWRGRSGAIHGGR
jgi:hypothetical protein